MRRRNRFRKFVKLPNGKFKTLYMISAKRFSIEGHARAIGWKGDIVWKDHISGAHLESGVLVLGEHIMHLPIEEAAQAVNKVFMPSTPMQSERHLSQSRANGRGLRNSARPIVATVMEKACSTCKLIKPATEFHKLRKSSTGLQPNCKDCAKKHVYASNDRFRISNTLDL